MATGVYLTLATEKADLLVRGVYGAGKTKCIAFLAAWFAPQGHHVYYELLAKAPPCAQWLPCYREAQMTIDQSPSVFFRVARPTALMALPSMHVTLMAMMSFGVLAWF